jgi:hypothetical protein
MQIVKDTLIVDRNNGKAMVRLTVNEGPRYRIGGFEVNGAKRFSNEDIARYYPFTEKGKSVAQTLKVFVGRGPDKEEANVFNSGAWDAATSEGRGGLRERRLHLRRAFVRSSSAGRSARTLCPRSIYAGRSMNGRRRSSTA